jgi:hypothetical protein
VLITDNIPFKNAIDNESSNVYLGADRGQMCNGNFIHSSMNASFDKYPKGRIVYHLSTQV